MAEEKTREQAERERMTARLEELGEHRVRTLAAVDGFPHHWRVGVLEWLAAKERG